MTKDNNFTPHMMVYVSNLEYKIEMTRSEFWTLVQFELAHLCMTYTQMIDARDFVSRLWSYLR